MHISIHFMIRFTSSSAVTSVMFCSAATGIYLSDRMHLSEGDAKTSLFFVPLS